MANPIYILHITDLHLEDNKEFIEGKFHPRLNKLIENSKKFLEIKSREAFDVVCITGDIMDQNGNNISHNLASDFINKLKGEIIKNNTSIYCVPGNHDLNDSKSKSITELNEYRLNCLKLFKNGYSFSKAVDKFKDKLIDCFTLYCQFMKDINATNCIAGDKYRSLTGSNKFDCGNSNFGLITWFNTSWLCLRDESWSEACKFKLDFELKNFDHEKLSPGAENTIANTIAFMKDNLATANFTIALCHHDPRLLCWHDKNNLGDETFFSNLFKNNIVLNGHTHNNLFDLPFLTTGKTNVAVIEVNHKHKFNIHYKIGMENSDVVSAETLNESKIITIFNNESRTFINELRSNYTIENLLLDIEANNEAVNGYTYPIQYQSKMKFNLLQRLDHDLEQKSRNL